MRKGTQEASFIDEQRILEALDAGKKYSTSDVLDVISKAKELKGLELEELSALLWVDDPEIEEESTKRHERLKRRSTARESYFSHPFTLAIIA